ncbi:Bsd2p KNAG_0A06990 [Huiozyma naganishii CBS 8797]|uniref:Metal homeostatis protein BSD2 n=1 Tax=Huiozyma naganishii (strain ATCC MYA-139 / BCRC 22969 / CBS 8797 / KCTC 17520 / NBRC 10181 / NCYC 3082 / Yp74L-3) TaxID=1071383 RepID=J7RFN1_HUIN7|nr:hypothetical protein KNAG_0A06990 [Kazachstania naganishii CBS 8797]CCK68353.1 hypothetical protein KNAG_0A06990 [Kazachstania naganishii CBS 8797]
MSNQNNTISGGLLDANVELDDIELAEDGVATPEGEAQASNVAETVPPTQPRPAEEIDHSGDVPNESGESTITEMLLPAAVRERATRHIDNIGRHFNILDRVFRHGRGNGNGESRGALFDGVFSNLTAKPDNNNSNQHDGQNDTPPTYDEAAADLVPSYYGMDLTSGDIYNDELCIEGLPVGNMANLIWNIIVSTSFQFIGFLITYMLHTSHAAKQGSRFGLGLTFLGYGYSMIPNNVVSKVGKHRNLDRIKPSDPNNYDDLHLNAKPSTQDNFESNLSHGIEEEKQKLPLLAVFAGLLGLFILLKSIVDFFQVKKKERRYLAQDSAV